MARGSRVRKPARRERREHHRPPPATPRAPIQFDRRDLLCILGLWIAGWLIYAPVFEFEFLNWDDPDYVAENPAIASLTPGSIAHLFSPSTIVVANWAPATLLSLAVDRARHGLDPGPFHRTNLMLHLVSAALVYALCRRVAFGRIAALAGAVAFLLHPIQVESVAWIAERKNVLSLPLALGAFLLSFEAERGRQAGAGSAIGRAAALLLFALALMAKATVVVMPLLLIAALVLLDRTSIGQAVRRALPYLLLSLAAGLVTLWAQGKTGAIKAYHGGSALLTAATMLRVFWLELALFFDPRRLSPIYKPPIAHSIFEPTVLLAALGLAAAAIAIWSLRRRAPRVTFFAAWYAIGLLPVSNLVPIPHLMADRFLYLSSIGLMGLLALALDAGTARSPARHARLPVTGIAAIGVVIAFALALAVATRTLLPVWHDSERLWRFTLSRTPDAEVAHANLGEALAARGEDAEALAHYQRALAIRPDYPAARLNLANALTRLGRTAEAESVYAQAVAGSPGDADALYNQGAARAKAGDRAGAESAYEAALRIDPKHAPALNSLAVLKMQAGDGPGALALLDRAVAANPTFAEAHSNRGLALGRLGRQAEAVAEIQQAIALAPNDPVAHFNLGLALLAEGDVAAARAAFARAIALDPGLANQVPPPAR